MLIAIMTDNDNDNIKYFSSLIFLFFAWKSIVYRFPIHPSRPKIPNSLLSLLFDTKRKPLEQRMMQIGGVAREK